MFQKKLSRTHIIVLASLVAVVAASLVLQVTKITKASPDVPNPGHPANQIEPGTFYSGDYTFPQNLTVGGNLNVGSYGDIYSDSSWLRLNQNHTQNIYTPRMIRADGGFQVDGYEMVGSNADKLYANRKNTSGGGIWISDDGGFYDYNNGYIDFRGSNGIRVLESDGTWGNNSIRATYLCMQNDCRSSWPSLSVQTTVASCSGDPCTVYCPSGYVRTGCSGYYRWWSCSSTGENDWYAQPYGSNGCRCFGRDGLSRCGGNATCYAYCLKVSL